MLVFFLEITLLTMVSGSSSASGCSASRCWVSTGEPYGPVRVVLRTFLLCLAVPALIWDRDGRGLHDKAAGSVVLTR